MSNISNNLSTLINTLNSSLSNISNNVTNMNNISYVKKAGDTMTGILNVSNIDSNTNLNIGDSSTSITFGSLIKTDNKTINIGGINDNININSNLNMNSNKITNVGNAVNNGDLMNLSNSNSLINSKIVNKLSDFTGLNNANINLNNNKLINVANAINDNDVVNLGQVNNLLPTKLSDLTVLNDANINVNNNKITNLANGINNNDAINLSQLNTLITSNIPTKLSQVNSTDNVDLNINSYKIINVANGINSNDVVTKEQVDTLVNNAKATKLSQLTGTNIADLNINTYNVTNVANGVSNTDAINYSQVTTSITNSFNTVPFSNINTYGSDVNNVLLGNGTFGKVSNSQIDDYSISVSKLTNYPNDGTKYLAGDGTFKSVTVSKDIGKWELFLNDSPPTSGYIRQGSFNNSSTLYPILADKYKFNNMLTILNGIRTNYKIGACNNLLLLCQASSTIDYYYSTDGYKWYSFTVTGSETDQNGNFLFANGFYVILNSSARFITSTLSGGQLRGGNGNLITSNIQFYDKIVYIYGNTYLYYTTDTFTTNTYYLLPSGSVTYLHSSDIILAVTDNGTFYCTSTDGITWTSRTLPNNMQFIIQFGLDKFIYVSTSSTQGYYSYDGITWTSMTLLHAGYANLSYGNCMFFAVGSNCGYAAYSFDGITWYSYQLALTGQSLSYTNTARYCTTFLNNFFIIAPQSQYAYLLKIVCPTPATITTIIQQYDTSSTNYTVASFIVNINDVLFRLGQSANYILTSTDNIIWTKIILPLTLSYNRLLFGNGIYILLTGSATYTYLTSTDLITWTQQTLPTITGGAYSITGGVYGNNIFILTTNTRYTLVSSNGISWTPSTTVFGYALSSITYGNNIFLININSGGLWVTTDNRYYSSNDGITWTLRTIPFIYTLLKRIEYVNNCFISYMSYNKAICVSTDGINWTKRYLPIISQIGTVNTIAYGNGFYILITDTTYQTIYYSTDTIKWYTYSKNTDPMVLTANIDVSRICYFKNYDFVAVYDSVKYITIRLTPGYNFTIPKMLDPEGCQYWMVAG